MYPGGRYISSTTHPNIGSALSISDSANRDPVSSAILKASGNQQYRGKSPLPTAGSLPTHSYYTRSKSVCLHCSSIVDSLPSCVLLVIFQVLKGAANETHTWYALVDSRLSMQSRSHALLFSRQAVFFFQTRELLLSLAHRFFLVFVVARSFALIMLEFPFLFCFIRKNKYSHCL